MKSLGIEEYLEKHHSYKDIEAVFHEGACADTTESRPDYILRINTGYTYALFNHCQKHKIPFLYASTAAIYGNGENGFQEEPDSEHPLNLYGESKLIFDNLLRRQIKRDGVLQAPAMGFRYFNVYGPGEAHKGRMASVALHLFKQGTESGKLKIFEGSENFKRDFIHVSDIVAVNLHFLQNPLTGIFNVGSGKARSFSDMARSIRELIPGSEIEHIPFPEDLKGKYQEFTFADLSNLRSAGYPGEFISLEEGLSEYFRDFKQAGGYLFGN
jgi:ADP-L-glycero-D-manno-heptose 6-epimerase